MAQQLPGVKGPEGGDVVGQEGTLTLMCEFNTLIAVSASQASTYVTTGQITHFKLSGQVSYTSVKLLR